MPYQYIGVETSSPVARLTMSWPEKRNALSLHMMNEMTRGLKALSASPDVRAVVLSRTVGRKRAMEMLLTGELIDAETAKE